MMDDIRPPRHNLERRDYSVPVRRPTPQEPPKPHAEHRPVQHQPAPVQPATVQEYVRPAPQPAAQPVHHQPVHHPAAHHQPQHRHPAKAKKRLGLRYLAVAIAFVVAMGIFTAGYLFKSKTPDKTIPASVVAKANFNVYFPSPMPNGYIYVSKTATFQIGDVFYRFANGTKSVTVREEPLPAKKPDLSLYKGYTIFTTGAGQAAIGSTFGQPVAVIVTQNSIITMNTGGGVTPQDLKTAINNLHNIGSSSQGVNNG